MKYDIEDIALRLNELSNLTYVLMVLHENFKRLGSNALRISDESYIDLFNLINNISHEEKEKLNFIASEIKNIRAEIN